MALRIAVMIDGRLNFGTIEARVGMVTSVGAITRMTDKAIFTDKPSARLHGHHRPWEVDIAFRDEFLRDPTFQLSDFCSAGTARWMRQRMASEGWSDKQMANYYGTKVHFVRFVLNQFPEPRPAAEG